jgi:hypothetical protein
VTALALAGTGGGSMAPPDPMFARDPEAIWFARPEDLEPAPVAPRRRR